MIYLKADMYFWYCMDRTELKKELDLLGVGEARYSLYDELKSDCIILFHNYYKWEVFYLDERGGRNEEKSFKTENEACLYIYGLFKDSVDTANKFGIKI